MHLVFLKFCNKDFNGKLLPKKKGNCLKVFIGGITFLFKKIKSLLYITLILAAPSRACMTAFVISLFLKNFLLGTRVSLFLPQVLLEVPVLILSIGVQSL